MKVAFIRTRYDPYGGAERFTQLLAETLTSRGVEVHLLARSWAEGADPRIQFHRVGGPTTPRLLAQVAFLLGVRRIVRQEGFDLVQSNERTLSQHVYRAGDGVHAAWLKVRMRNLSAHQRLAIDLNPSHRYRLWVERRLFTDPNLSAVIVNSNMIRQEIMQHFGLPSERIRTIYNGVDLERFHPALRATEGASLRSDYGIGPGTPIVLFVGSGFERKGLTPLIRAVAEAGGNYRLWVVGKGSTRTYERLAEKVGLTGRITFFGPQKHVEPFYAAADVFALPTLYDPFPSVVLEAMATGVPVITSTGAGAAEILTPGQEGFVVPVFDNVDQMAASLLLLFDPARRRRMGEAARRRAEDFPIQRTADEYLHLYEELLGRDLRA